MEINVRFFGVLAEVTQTSFKHYRDIKSFDDLRLRIEDDYPEIVHYNYLISVNNELISTNPLLNNDDEVAFMPPFTGG